MISLMHRTIVIMLPLAATAMLLAGCGKSNPASPSRVNPRVTAQDLVYADAINLRASDVPKLAGNEVKPRPAMGPGPLGETVEACDGADESGTEILGIGSERRRNQGALISRPFDIVGSEVYLFPSAALAHRDFTAADRPRVRACWAHAIPSEVLTRQPEEPPYTQIEVSALPSPLRGVPVYGLRMKAAYAFGPPSPTGRSNYYEDRFGFMIGRALVTLTDAGDPQPFPAATEHRLLSLLYTRAEAHKL